MCGFVGFLQRSGGLATGDGDAELKKMAGAIVNRGPDDEGYWQDAESGIGLGHRRLSVIDLSAAGHQPMVSASGRYVIAFNGEIYNFQDIRRSLDAADGSPAWHGHSDTETLLAGFDRWGIVDTLNRCTGMFAFGLWDKQEKTLTLARDRLGEKPLYYGWQGKTLLFGSELKALRQHSAFNADVDRNALCLFLRHNYVPSPYSIYEGVAKLPPGSYLTVSRDSPEPRVTNYWSAADVAVAGAADPFRGTPEEAVDELETRVSDAIRQQMIADVPLGAFLSGGIDSSTVVALMQSQSARPVKTFSIGFHEDAYNEADHAKLVAEHLGTEHTELYVSPEEALAVIPQLPEIYSEPFSDSSQVPTVLVSRLARQDVTVSLSGDGGDELLCGYTRYERSAKLWKRLRNIPGFARSALAKAISLAPPAAWDKLAKIVPGIDVDHFGDRVHKSRHAIASRSLDELYLNFLMSHNRDPGALVIGGTEPPTLMTGNAPALPGLDNLQRMMTLDQLSYLPDDILAKVDRAAMAVSLETRVPFLDHRVVEFASSLPQSIKVRDGQAKWPLRQVLYRHVDRKLIDRPKMGFGVPIEHWLRGPLRDWGEELLGEQRLRDEGFFEPAAVRKMWTEHVEGKRRWHHHLWDLLMFQAWLECQKTN